MTRRPVNDTGTYTLADGREGDVRSVLEGVVLTSFIAAHEEDGGRLELEPDFGLLLALGVAELPVVGGHALTIVHEMGPFGAMWTLGGPPGWPPKTVGDELLVLRLVSGEVAISTVEVDDEETAAREEECVEAILRAHHPVAEALGFSDPLTVLLTVLVDHPGVFRAPMSPVRDLFEQAGLIQDEDRLMTWEAYQARV
ncbi:hypothetical protein [Euzebya sp.]|uniref:hypothetical protein n=1 Tax=Euzebya sp. TaxID=1971409 RepID=UPI003513DACA